MYHANAKATLRARKRITWADFFEGRSQSVWQLLQDPQRAARLRSITMLRPLYNGNNETRYLKTAWAEQESHVDHVLGTTRQNVPGLRFFE